MSHYCLLNKNKTLITFEYIDNEVVMAVLNKQTIDYLPLPIKRIFLDINGCVDNITDDGNYYILNENGCYFIDNWITDREIPTNRDNIEKYIQNKNKLTSYMLDNNAFSLTDNYWIKKIDEPLVWENILAKRKGVDEYYTYKIGNKEYYKGHNATLGGQLEKYWYKENGVLMLCKKTPKLNDILNAREVLASLIYKKQKALGYSDYTFVYDTMNEVVGCKCPSFILDDTVELITAFDLLEERGKTQDDNCYDLIINYASEYGLSKELARNYLDMQTIVDYLITNRDRHQNNIGFIRDSETHKIISVAPVFDSGSSANLEGEYPEGVGNTKINGLYNTEKELLSHVSDFSLVDVSKLPTENEVRDILNKCHYISNERKEKLITLYLEKKERLSEIQKLSDRLTTSEIIETLFASDIPLNNNAIDVDYEL